MEQKQKKIKVACVAMAEMGHFIPITHIADALIRRGHEVYVITNNDAHNDHKASMILNSIDCKNQVFTECGLKRTDMFRKGKGLDDIPDLVFLGHWLKFVRKEITKIMPDVVVCDFFSRTGVIVADELGIPSVINAPALYEFM